MTDLSTPSKRARLAAKRNPYFAAIAGPRGGISLGWRPGVWIAKVVVEGERVEEKIAAADDDGCFDVGALAYKSAVAKVLDWARRKRGEIEALKESASGIVPTVASAVADYAAGRKARDGRTGAITEGRLKLHVLADAAFAATELRKLRAGTIEAWRARLAPMKPATQNRLLNDLRAALNQAIERDRRHLPAHLSLEVKIGTRRASVEDKARRQILDDGQVRAAVEAAFALDDDFGRLVLLAAVSGARYSQLAALRIEDLQADRIMIPGSKKGRSARARPPAAVPLSPDAIARLRPAVAARDGSEPLLTRWAYAKGENGTRWQKTHRRPLGPAYEIDKPWAAVVERAGLPGKTIMYALRHSSIVRGLKAGLPVRLVAALHDTSSQMIEEHYSRFILDASEALARRAALSLEA